MSTLRSAESTFLYDFYNLRNHLFRHRLLELSELIWVDIGETLDSAGHGVGEAIGSARASTLGDRATVPGAQNRTRSRSFRRTLVSRLDPSRRPHGGGV